MASLVRFPDGLQVYALDTRNAVLVHGEVFRDEVYFRHGITVRDGDFIFDVGANIGLFLVQLNRRLRHGRVFCFEPIPEIFGFLEQNARVHNRLALTLFNVGLAGKTGSARFTFFPRLPADSCMCPDDSERARAQHRDYILRVLEGKTNIPVGRPARLLLAVMPSPLRRRVAEWVRRFYMTGRPVYCPVRNLSEVIDEHGVGQIDLLKMDVEGAEFAILAGLRREHWPRLRQAVVEVHGGPGAASAMCRLLGENSLAATQEADPARPNNFMVYARRPAP